MARTTSPSETIPDTQRFEGFSLVGKMVRNTVHGLLDAHAEYDEAEQLGFERRQELDAEIGRLTKERDGIEKDRERAVSAQSQQRHNFSYGLERLVNDPESDIHPVYRAVLRAATMEQGSLWYPHSFEAADHLGTGLAEMSDSLTTSTDTQPAVSLVKLTSGDEVLALRIDSGMTERGKGLTSHVGSARSGACSCGQVFHTKMPHLKLPVAEQTIVSAEPDLRRPFYTRSDGRVVKFKDNARSVTVLDRIDIEAASPKIDLPTGNVYRDRSLIAVYDTAQGPKEVTGPRKFLSGDASVSAVGEQSVIQLLKGYRKEAKAHLKNPFLHYDVAEFVASSLGVTLGKMRTR